MGLFCNAKFSLRLSLRIGRFLNSFYLFQSNVSCKPWVPRAIRGVYHNNLITPVRQAANSYP